MLVCLFAQLHWLCPLPRLRIPQPPLVLRADMITCLTETICCAARVLIAIHACASASVIDPATLHRGQHSSAVWRPHTPSSPENSTNTIVMPVKEGTSGS
jgi:hypothetical protein